MTQRLLVRLVGCLGSSALACAALTAGTAGGAAAGVVTTAATRARAGTYQNWPTFLQNTARTAATTDPVLSIANAPALALKWAHQTGGPMATSASIVGTTAYVGAWDGYEYAINTTTGKQIWRTNLGITTTPPAIRHDRRHSSAADVNGVVYVGGGGPYWYALEGQPPAQSYGGYLPAATARPGAITTGPAR